MTVHLRADASSTIGTGHIVRQMTLGREIANRGEEVVLLGGIEGPQWVLDMLRGEDSIRWKPVPIGSFGGREFEEIRGERVVVDSYFFGLQESRQLTGQGAKVIQFWDGPWQPTIGPMIVAPALEDHPTTLMRAKAEGLEIFSGPELIMMRSEIQEVRRRRAEGTRGAMFRVVVVFGGAPDQTDLSWVLGAIGRLDSTCKVDIFAGGPGVDGRHMKNLAPSIRFHPVGPEILPYLEEASCAVSAAGTTAMELIYLSIPSVFIPVAQNQSENAHSISRHKLGLVIDPESPDKETQLFKEIWRQKNLFESGRAELLETQNGAKRIDDYGAARIADIVLS